MMTRTKEPLPALQCRTCGEYFHPTLGKKGYINQCGGCATDVPLLGGRMIYEHKTAGYIEIRPMAKTLQDLAATKRLGGSGVTASITERKS